jgi:hypothetical protein
VTSAVLSFSSPELYTSLLEILTNDVILFITVTRACPANLPSSKPRNLHCSILPTCFTFMLSCLILSNFYPYPLSPQDILDTDASGMKSLQRAILHSLARFDMEHLITRLLGVLSGATAEARRGDLDDLSYSANTGPDPR